MPTMSKRSAILGLTAVLSQFDLSADTTATATVTYTVSSILSITVSGNPGNFTINTATAGSAPTAATDSTTTYSVTTNGSSSKVTGSVSTAMPSGVSLSVNLAAPAGGTSLGDVSLTTTDQDLVTGIANLAQTGLGITYTLAATTAAATVTNATATVTYTIQ